LVGSATFGHAAYRRTSARPAAAQVREDAAALRATLGGSAFDAAWAEGQAMGLEGAVEYALGLQPPTRRDNATLLTTRELDVARLVAAGKSNREIAAALVITEPTAERHVANSRAGDHRANRRATRGQQPRW
jgi:DNA-binding NarL/FixJ family response regulator